MKTLKLTTIEKRFRKLHDVANFAESYAKAITTHVQPLLHEGQDNAIRNSTVNMTEYLDKWTEKFVHLASEMQRIESLYYKTVNGETAELIEAIPTTTGHPTEEQYKMTEELCRIGYIQIEGDPFLTSEKRYTDKEIVDNVRNMHQNLILCIKALANANYTGIWSDVHKLAVDIQKSLPNHEILSFLETYGMMFADNEQNK